MSKIKPKKKRRSVKASRGASMKAYKTRKKMAHARKVMKRKQARKPKPIVEPELVTTMPTADDVV